MHHVRVDFEADADLDRIRKYISECQPDAVEIAGDFFDRYVARQEALAATFPYNTERLHPIVTSARLLQERQGPGVEFHVSVNGKPVTIQASCGWVQAIFAAEPTTEQRLEIEKLFEGFGKGTITAFDV